MALGYQTRNIHIQDSSDPYAVAVCVIVAFGNWRWSSCIKSATTMPNKVGLSLLPSGSPRRISTLELRHFLGCRTRILTMFNLRRRSKCAVLLGILCQSLDNYALEEFC